MKKIFALLIFILVLMSVISIVMADNDNNETEDNQTCTIDADCLSGLICNSGECEEIESESIDNTECVVDTDCTDGLFCDDGECEDSLNEDEVSDETGQELEDDETAEVEEDEEIENEAKLLQTNLGSKVRLLLLERAVTKSIARGEIVVNYLEDKYAGSDLLYISDLNDIMDKLSSIVTEIQDLKEQEGLTVKKYVQLRKDSWDLIRQFKRIVWENTSPVDREEIRTLLSEADYSFMDELKQEIKDTILEHNAEQVKEIRAKLGNEGSDFSEDVRSGKMTSEEARTRLMEEYKKLNEERRTEAEKRLEEARTEAEKKRTEARTRIMEDSAEAQKTRIELRKRMETRANELRNELRTQIREEIKNKR